MPAIAHQEVLRLDVSVNDPLRVDGLKTADELVGEHQHRLERELAAAEAEEVFQAWSEKVEHHGVVVALLTEPVDLRYAGPTG